MFCKKCGAEVPNGVGFCTKCGNPMGAVAAPNPAPQPQMAPNQQFQGQQFQGQYYQPQPVIQPWDHTAEFDAADISDNKVVAMSCYILGFIGIIISLLAAKDSKYAAFHARQGLKLSVCSALCGLMMFVPVLGWICGPIGALILFVVKIICFFGVCGGKAKEPAIIRSFGFLK